MSDKALQEYILNISTVSIALPDGVENVVTSYPPSPFQSLIFYCNDPVSMSRIETGNVEAQPLAILLGPQCTRVNIQVHKIPETIRVDSPPGGLFRMLGVPFFFNCDYRILAEHSDLEEGRNMVEKFRFNRSRKHKIKIK